MRFFTGIIETKNMWQKGHGILENRSPVRDELLLLFSHNQVLRGHRTGFSHSVWMEVRNTRREKHKRPKVVHAYITADAIHASTRNLQEKWNRKSGKDVPGLYWYSYLLHTSHYSRLWRNRLYRLPPKKDYHVYITRSIYHYAYARQTHVNWKKKRQITNKKRQEKEEKRRKRKKRKKKKKITRKQENARQEEEAKKGKENKMSNVLADFRNWLTTALVS